MSVWVSRYRQVGCLLTIAIGVAIGGCGKSQEYGMKGVKLRGRIVQGGEPLPLDRPDVGLGVVELALVPEGQNSAIDFASARNDGRFEFLGDGQGVQPGNYRLAVLHHKSGPGTDELAGKLSQANTKIPVNVPVDNLDKAFDVGDIELNDYLKNE
jgi:hypothetical protein